MNFDEFQQRLMADLQGKLRGDYGHLSISQVPVQKLQNESYDAIVVRRDPSAIGVTLNANMLFEQYQRGTRYEAVLGVAEMTARRGMDNAPEVQTNLFRNYDDFKDKLVVELVPRHGNEEMLAQIPHRNMEDLAIVYRFVLQDGPNGRTSVLLNNAVTEALHVTPDRLHADALASSVNHYPPEIRNMRDVIAEMMDESPENLPESPMYCVTSSDKLMGAAAITYPGVLDEAAEMIGGSFHVLPSSVHEVLLMPDSEGFDYHEMENMVRNINREEVSPADWLSDNVYHYDAAAHVFELASTYAERSAAAREELLADEMPDWDSPSTMTVLLVEPNKYPKAVEMGTGLEALQQAVGGYIECVYPTGDPVCIICNEEGKLDGLPLNRAVRDEDGTVTDIIAGSFLVAGLDDETGFGSLTSLQMEKYEEMFHQPEAFVKTGRGFITVPIPDETIAELSKEAPAKAKDQPSL